MQCVMTLIQVSPAFIGPVSMQGSGSQPDIRPHSCSARRRTPGQMFRLKLRLPDSVSVAPLQSAPDLEKGRSKLEANPSLVCMAKEVYGDLANSVANNNAIAPPRGSRSKMAARRR